MKDRIIEVRKKASLNQENFAKKINLTKNYISLIETGNRIPSDRTVSDICREFNINEQWLRTGEGEMYAEPSDDFMEIATLIDIKDPLAKKVIMEYWKLTDEDKKLFWKFMERFTKL